jgi:hypothetical protein
MLTMTTSELHPTIQIVEYIDGIFSIFFYDFFLVGFWDWKKVVLDITLVLALKPPPYTKRYFSFVQWALHK